MGPTPTTASGTTSDLRYDELGRLGRPGAWRHLAGVGLLVALVLVAQVLLGAVVSAYLAATGDSAGEIADKLGGDPATPSYLALVNLGWAVAIPLTWLVVRAVHGQARGRLASVVGRLRWRWFAVCLLLATITLAVTIAVGSVLPDQGGGTVEVDGALNPWTSTARDFLLVIVLLTPLQAAGEEYVFRGYLAQALGGLAAPWGRRVAAGVAIVVPSLLFALAHGAQDLPIFIDRLAFGLVAGVVVLITGGLEAGIAMHVLNNLFAFGLALAVGDMTESLQPTAGSWWALPVTLTQSLTFVALVAWAARRGGVRSRGGGPVLAASPARV